jgi:hypothetical protein
MFVKSLGGGALLAALVAIFDRGALLILLSLVVGTALAFLMLLLAVRARVDAAVRRSGRTVLRIDKSSGRSWKICQLVERITLTRAWRSGLVDRERVVPGVTFRSLSTALHLAAAEADVARAETHSDLRELAAARRRELDQEAASLHEIERRLHHVLRAAEQLDERQRQAERNTERAREEAELRQRLASPELSVGSSPHDVDEVLGVHARAEALNELLAESDEIAAGLRSHP